MNHTSYALILACLFSLSFPSHASDRRKQKSIKSPLEAYTQDDSKKNDSKQANLSLSSAANIAIQDLLLTSAIRNGQLGSVKKIMKNGPNINDRIGGKTLLMIAAKSGHVEIARYFIEKGAELEVVDENNCNALMFAVQAGHADMVNLLIESGINVNRVSRDGNSALSIALQFITRGNERNAFMTAAKNGDTRTAEFLLDFYGVEESEGEESEGEESEG